MELTIKQNRVAGEAQRVVIALAGRTTIGEIDKINQALATALADCSELLLDVAGTTAVDLSLLQLVHAAQLSAEAAGIRFELAGELSDAFRVAALSTGFLPVNANEIISSESLREE